MTISKKKQNSSSLLFKSHTKSASSSHRQQQRKTNKIATKKAFNNKTFFDSIVDSLRYDSFELSQQQQELLALCSKTEMFQRVSKYILEQRDWSDDDQCHAFKNAFRFFQPTEQDVATLIQLNEKTICAHLCEKAAAFLFRDLHQDNKKTLLIYGLKNKTLQYQYPKRWRQYATCFRDWFCLSEDGKEYPIPLDEKEYIDIVNSLVVNMEKNMKTMFLHYAIFSEHVGMRPPQPGKIFQKVKNYLSLLESGVISNNEQDSKRGCIRVLYDFVQDDIEAFSEAKETMEEENITGKTEFEFDYDHQHYSGRTSHHYIIVEVDDNGRMTTDIDSNLKEILDEFHDF